MKKANLKLSLITKRAAFSLILCFFAIFSFACGYKPLATVRSEAEAIEMIDVLREYNIQADKLEVGEAKNREYQIVVDENSFGSGEGYASAIQILSDHCLPRAEPPAIQEGSFIASNDVEKAKVQRQLQLNIISQLQKLPSVTCVYVNFVQPQDQLAAYNPYPATAGVTINYKTPEISFTQQDVKNLVARAVPNLQPDNVAAVLLYQPIRPIAKANRNFAQKLILIGALGLLVIGGSIFLMYYLQKRRQRITSTALIERPEDLESAEIVES